VISRRLNWLVKTFLVTLGLTLLLSSSSSFASTESEPPLISVTAVREMSRAEMARHNEVRVRGTVTFVNGDWHVLFVYQDGQSVKVGFDFDTQVSVGTLIEITGSVVLGDVSPVIVATGIEVLSNDDAPGNLKPAAFKIDRTTQFSVSLVDQWVEFEGQAYSAVADDERHYVSLVGEQFGVYAMIPNSKDLPPLATLRKTKIRVRGIPAISIQPGAEGQIDLLVPNSTFVDVLPADDETADSKLRNIAAIGRVDMQGTAETPARIRAVVRTATSHGRLFVSDETGSLMVEAQSGSAIEKLVPGDVVEVEGRVVRNQEPQYITEALVRYIGKGFSLIPQSTTATEALNRPAALIQIDGTLVARNDAENWLLLKNGTHSFRVRSRRLITSKHRQWGVGSRFRFTGCTWGSENQDADFELYPNSVSVVFGLSVETASEENTAALSAATPAQTIPTVEAEPFLFRSSVRLALQITLIVLAGLIVWIVHHRLKEQERFQESIHEQLSNLSHIARLNTLSEMVGALAHELNQPLASVSNYAATAELLSKKEPADSEKLSGVLTLIGQEAFRAGEIIRRLRHLVRRKTPGSLAVRVSEIIHETVELFKTQHVTASGLVQLDVPDNLPAVQADSVQIQQVILNLLLNARDATEAQSDRISSIQVETSSGDGMVCVTVADNGIGIASETSDAIFEPYFTTREQGTGLGLAISRTIIETHGGKITAQKGSPFGTRITFSLPISRTQTNIAG